MFLKKISRKKNYGQTSPKTNIGKNQSNANIPREKRGEIAKALDSETNDQLYLASEDKH